MPQHPLATQQNQHRFRQVTFRLYVATIKKKKKSEKNVRISHVTLLMLLT